MPVTVALNCQLAPAPSWAGLAVILTTPRWPSCVTVKLVDVASVRSAWDVAVTVTLIGNAPDVGAT